MAKHAVLEVVHGLDLHLREGETGESPKQPLAGLGQQVHYNDGAEGGLEGLRSAGTRHEVRQAAKKYGLEIIATVFGTTVGQTPLIYAIVGLVIFAGFTMYDFQRLRKTKDIRAAPLLAASIFLDVLNVFLLLLSLFNRR